MASARQATTRAAVRPLTSNCSQAIAPATSLPRQLAIMASSTKERSANPETSDATPPADVERCSCQRRQGVSLVSLALLFFDVEMEGETW